MTLSSLVFSLGLVILFGPSDNLTNSSQSETVTPMVEHSEQIPNPNQRIVIDHSATYPNTASLGTTWERDSVTLRIWNLPYGVWVEIANESGQQVLYHHSDSTGMYHVAVPLHMEQGINGNGIYEPFKIRVARSPNDLRTKRLLFEDELSLVAGYSIDFDYVREKATQEALSQGEQLRRYVGRPNLPVAFVATTRPATTPAPQDDDFISKLKGALKFEPVIQSDNFSGRLNIQFNSANSTWVVDAEPPPGGPRVLKVTAEKKILDIVSKKWSLKAKGEIQVDHAAAGQPKKSFPGLAYELSFEPVSADATQSISWLTIVPGKFHSTLGNNDLSKFLQESMPTTTAFCEAKLTMSEIEVTVGESKEPVYSQRDKPIVVHLKLLR